MRQCLCIDTKVSPFQPEAGPKPVLTPLGTQSMCQLLPFRTEGTIPHFAPFVNPGFAQGPLSPPGAAEEGALWMAVAKDQRANFPEQKEIWAALPPERLMLLKK